MFLLIKTADECTQALKRVLADDSQNNLEHSNQLKSEVLDYTCEKKVAFKINKYNNTKISKIISKICRA